MHQLGYTNIATTSRYLTYLVSAENTFASKLLDAMGIEDEAKDSGYIPIDPLNRGGN